MKHYILIGHEAVVEPDLLTWARWLETADRSVAFDEVALGVGLSTVFLGLDHNLGIVPTPVGRRHTPVLFETMLFRETVPGAVPYGELLKRYATWDEAESGHARFSRVYRRVCPWCGHLRDRPWTCQQCGKAFVRFRKFQYLRLPNGSTRVWVRP